MFSRDWIGHTLTTHHLDAREGDARFIAEMSVVSGGCAIKLAYNNNGPTKMQ